MRRQLCTLYIRTINGDDRALMVGYGYDKTEADRIFHRIGNVEIWCVDANEEKYIFFWKHVSLLSFYELHIKSMDLYNSLF